MPGASATAACYTPPADHVLHPGYSHKVLQAWQSAGDIPKSSLVFPLFLVDDVRDRVAGRWQR